MSEYYCQSDFEKSCEDIRNLLKENNNLKKENAQLKAKLDKKQFKKTVPQNGASVRDKESGYLGYSIGKLDDNNCLKISDFQGGKTCSIVSSDWEEIEIKVKE